LWICSRSPDQRAEHAREQHARAELEHGDGYGAAGRLLDGHGRGLPRLRLADQDARVSAFSAISLAACGRASRRALARIAAMRVGSSSRRSIL